MYRVKKTMEIAGSHCLDLPYESKCKNMHGHNWIITVYCKAEKLDENGMVIDFALIKGIVNNLDHKNLNEIITGNPTAENIARSICDQIGKCYKVEVQESIGNIAIYERDL